MTKKTVKSLIAVLMLLTVCLYFISGTYARYTSTASGTAEVQVAKWAVKINNVDVVANKDLTIAFKEVASEYVVNDKIAPASELYAEFVIDPAGSEVAMDYSFELGTITATDGTVPTSLTVSKVVVMDGDVETETLTKGTDGKYTRTIELTSQTAALQSTDAETVRVYVSWEDKNNDTDNATDTAFGALAPKLTMQVKATATQHV